MANSLTKQVILDGPRNQHEKYEQYLDTADVAQTTLTDPTLWNFNSVNGYPKIDEIQYSIEDGITLDLWWDATTPVRIASLTGRGRFKPPTASGWPNNGGAGVTGKILYATQGWVAGGGAGNAGIYTCTFDILYKK